MSSKSQKDKSEVLWKEDQNANNWKLPEKAPFIFRLPIIRHIRAAILIIRMERHYSFGLGCIGAFRSGYDEWVVYAIKRGWC